MEQQRKYCTMERIRNNIFCIIEKRYKINRPSIIDGCVLRNNVRLSPSTKLYQLISAVACHFICHSCGFFHPGKRVKQEILFIWNRLCQRFKAHFSSKNGRINNDLDLFSKFLFYHNLRFFFTNRNVFDFLDQLCKTGFFFFCKILLANTGCI